MTGAMIPSVDTMEEVVRFRVLLHMAEYDLAFSGSLLHEEPRPLKQVLDELQDIMVEALDAMKTLRKTCSAMSILEIEKKSHDIITFLKVFDENVYALIIAVR